MSAGYIAKRALEWAMPERVVVRGAGGSKSGIVLTFDDGPHLENTPRILDGLDEAGVKATFFVQGTMVKANPSIVRDAVRRGHRIGNHGYRHLSARAVPVAEYVSDVLQCQSLLLDVLGSGISLDFRPPYGHLTPGSLWATVRKGFRTVLWSIDSRDSFVRDSGELTQLVTHLPLGASGVMLFHDDYAHTAKALPAMLAALKSRGCKFSQLDGMHGLPPSSTPQRGIS